MPESTTTLVGSSNGVTGHSFYRRMPGDVATVRERMIGALESFDYVVLSDDPLRAKREGGFSMNVLNCALELLISFRQSSQTTTNATFTYTIPLSMVTSGDLHTVEREAEALIAVASRRQSTSVCVMCGTSNGGDSRFCRGCGAPNAAGLPAELEVMRLTAETRAGHQAIVTGVCVILSILAMAIPLIYFGQAKRETVGWVLLILGQMTGWSALLYGLVRVHRALNPPSDQPSVMPRHSIPIAEPKALHPQSAWSSISEGTTELLDARAEKQVTTPAERNAADTGSMT